VRRQPLAVPSRFTPSSIRKHRSRRPSPAADLVRRARIAPRGATGSRQNSSVEPQHAAFAAGHASVCIFEPGPCRRPRADTRPLDRLHRAQLFARCDRARKNPAASSKRQKSRPPAGSRPGLRAGPRNSKSTCRGRAYSASLHTLRLGPCGVGHSGVLMSLEGDSVAEMVYGRGLQRAQVGRLAADGVGAGFPFTERSLPQSRIQHRLLEMRSPTAARFSSALDRPLRPLRVLRDPEAARKDLFAEGSPAVGVKGAEHAQVAPPHAAVVIRARCVRPPA